MKLETEGYKLESDGMCIVLTKTVITGERSKNPGEFKEKVIGFYPDFSKALDRWLEEKIADSTAEDIRQLRGDIADAKAEMRRMASAKKE